MKNTFHTIVLALLSLLFVPNISFGQLYEVPLDEKIEKSTLIVEGKVVEAKCFRTQHGDIYTANKIEVGSLLKGQFQNRFLTITTWGGELEEETQTWTHLLSLKKGDYGLFFLEPTRVESINDVDFPESFDVYCGSQGFLAFKQNDSKAWIAREPFHVYLDVENDLFAKIARETDQKLTIINESGREIRNGVRYHFKDIAFNGLAVTFNVYVNSLVGNKKLYKSGIQIAYNPVFFGSNLATNGNLVMQDAGISNTSIYDLTQSDVTSSKVKIELLPVGSITGLTEITTTEQLLAKGQITIQNILADPTISYDIVGMQSLSKFYEGGSAQIFDTVIVEGSWRPSGCTPVIKSFSPPSVAGGVGEILTIKGKCFQNFVEGFSFVQFTDAQEGITTIKFMEPLTTDHYINCGFPSIICWSDTLIKVKVPSVGKITYDSLDNDHFAGTGKIRVYNYDGKSKESDSTLYVRYSAINGFTKSGEVPSKTSLPRTLRDANGNGGMTLTFGNEINIDVPAKEAFKRALKTWKCATKINFVFDPSIPNSGGDTCFINLLPLPGGSLSTLAETTTIPMRCKDIASGAFVKSTVKKFKIIFNSSKPFYKLEPLSGLTAADFDFESTALHELGHAHILNHVNQLNDPMYYSLDKGISQRSLTNDDIEGGLKIMEISGEILLGTDCSTNVMQPANVSGLGCVSSLAETNSDNPFITLFPNPVNESLSYSLSPKLKLTENVFLEFYDISGRVISSIKIATREGQIEVSSFPNGVIFGVLSVDGHHFSTFKVIKQ